VATIVGATEGCNGLNGVVVAMGKLIPLLVEVVGHSTG
jgi:L-serine deaminase